MRSLIMRCFTCFRKDVADMERQGRKNNGTIYGSKMRWLFHWDVAFLVVRVVSVGVDPLFLYLPVINEATKCITIDNTLKIIAICLRSLLDLIASGDLVTPPRPGSRGYTWLDYLSHILGILPIPQVLLPRIPKMSGSKNLRKFLNAVVFLQYGPRIFSIYRSVWRKVNQTETNIPSTTTQKKIKVVMKGLLNLYLYLVASHVLGAFWYFFSIERETTCWQLACEHDIGCSKTTLDCDEGFGNYTILNDYCSIEKPNTTLFDFGIFQKARQSGILASMDFLQKIMFCFWWGLRNLSSLGQNLETTLDFWENCFTVLISIFGLLLFSYLIGNLQVYMQWHTSNELEKAEKRLEEKKEKKATLLEEKEAKRWEEAKPLQLEEAKRWEEAKRLQLEEAKRLQLEEALPLLRKVPIFENELSEEFLYEITCKFLKQVHYNQSSYIVREGEPLDALIFVVKGIAWTYTSNHDNKTECLKTGDLFGRHLVDWALKSPELSDLPLSTRTLKCHTKIEAFCLMASDLKEMLSQYWWKYSKLRYIPNLARNS